MASHVHLESSSLVLVGFFNLGLRILWIHTASSQGVEARREEETVIQVCQGTGCTSQGMAAWPSRHLPS